MAPKKAKPSKSKSKTVGKRTAPRTARPKKAKVAPAAESA